MVIMNNAVGRTALPQQRTHAFSMVALGFSTASVVGSVLAGFAIDGLGHARAFLLLSAFPFIGAAMMLLLHPRVAPLPAAPPARTAQRLVDMLHHAPLPHSPCGWCWRASWPQRTSGRSSAWPC
jgi:predicted MFS family arabinose efflux permease